MLPFIVLPYCQYPMLPIIRVSLQLNRMNKRDFPAHIAGCW
jgi:hypothetical protein